MNQLSGMNRSGIDAVIYARYSSDNQREESIDAQVRACRQYAEAHGFRVLKVYADEAISGKGSKTSSRKEYQRMLRDAERKKMNIILVHKYDRVARNVLEHALLANRLAEHEVEIISVAQDFGDSNEAKIMKVLTWAMSEYYIDNLSSETKKGLQENALDGVFNGGVPPFGYNIVDQQYVINELEANYVRRMFECAASRKGFTDLLAEMNQQGITGKRGKPFRYSSIYEILRNEKYTGAYIYSVDEEKTGRIEEQSPMQFG